MNDQERRDICQRVAQDMHAAGLGWNYDAIERLTRPPIVTAASFARWAQLQNFMAVKYRRRRRPSRRQKRRARKARGQ